MATTILDPRGFAYTPNLKGVDRFTYWVMPAYLVTQAVWYKIMGFSLFSMRLLSIVWSIVALLSWFSIVHSITANRNLALLAVCLLGTEQQFIRSAGFGRMDMMCFALGLASLASYLALRDRRFLLSVSISASLAAWALFTHPNGIFGSLLLAGFVLWLDRNRITVKSLLLGALPFAVLGLLWGTYILRAPNLFFAQIHAQSAFLHLPLNLPRELWSEISDRYSLPYNLRAPFPILLGSLVFYVYILAVVVNLVVPELRRSRASRVFLAMAALQFAALVCVKKSWYYIVYIVPFYTVLVAIAARWLWLQTRTWRFGVGVAVVSLLALNICFILARAHNDDKAEFQQAVAFLKRNTAPGSLTMGSGELGFGLGFEGEIVDDSRLGFLSGRKPDYIVLETQYRSYWFPWFEKHEPATRSYIQSLLKQYSLIYDPYPKNTDGRFAHWGYQVYRRRTPLNSISR